MNTYFDDYDYCFVTGQRDGLSCYLCPYKKSCSCDSYKDDEEGDPDERNRVCDN